jgi:hypothetical protein
MRILALITTALIFGIGTLRAGTFEESHAAYQREDYAESVRLARLAASEGDVRILIDLGAAYELGHGVPQDYVRAHMWYNLSPSDTARKWRDALAQKMTIEQVAEAKRLTRECARSNFKNCDN